MDEREGERERGREGGRRGGGGAEWLSLRSGLARMDGWMDGWKRLFRVCEPCLIWQLQNNSRVFKTMGDAGEKKGRGGTPCQFPEDVF